LIIEASMRITGVVSLKQEADDSATVSSSTDASKSTSSSNDEESGLGASSTNSLWSNAEDEPEGDAPGIEAETEDEGFGRAIDEDKIKGEPVVLLECESEKEDDDDTGKKSPVIDIASNSNTNVTTSASEDAQDSKAGLANDIIASVGYLSRAASSSSSKTAAAAKTASPVPLVDLCDESGDSDTNEISKTTDNPAPVQTNTVST